jgi:serine/threonine-protein kinase
MPRRAAAPRDLLFALLALQNGMVGQAQLVAAFGAWSASDRAMADLLVEYGGLTEPRRVLLEALLTEYLAAHGNDAETGLAALDVTRSTLEGLAAAGGPAFEVTLTHVGIGSATAGDADRTITYTVGTATADGNRYRVLRPHARGGLGAVFVALDSELKREVALKRILDHHADDPVSRQRFLVEAEITGGLEHPGIVPVYGLGTYGDGRPYYAMRFIRGDSLKEAADQFHAGAHLRRDPGARTLELHKLLRRFLDVCNAVHYAHTRGILHRDLKPGNVIVGQHGETLVVDWGLAKPLNGHEPGDDAGEAPLVPSSASGSSETLPGTAVGTPAYMSPEQAAGAHRLSVRSDVYGLGATLYYVLTGHAPFAGEVGDVLRAVQAGRLARPRQHDPLMDRGLEAICLKAMALGPQDRYATPRALCEDIERWLADEPVAAWREPLGRRARRWMRRHRSAVTAAVFAGPVLAGALALGYWRETAYSASLAKINRSLDAQRRRAEDREQEAIAAVQRFGEVVSNTPALKNRSALDSLRKELLKEPLSFFRSLRDRLVTDRETRPEALARLSSACYQLGGLTYEIGDTQDALRAFRESLAVRQKLADANPSVGEYQNELARSHDAIGLLLSVVGRATEALRSYERALAIRQKLADANPTVAEFQSDLARSHSAIGLLRSDTGQTAEALRSYERALEIRRALADAKPAVARFQSELARSHNAIGLLLSDAGRAPEALRSYERALEIRQALADAHPADRGFHSDLALSHYNLGTVQSGMGRSTEALRSFERSLAIQERLSDANPTLTELQRDLAASHNAIGAQLSDTGRVSEALQSYERALAVRRRIAAEHPDWPELASDVGGTLNNVAVLDLRARRWPQARDCLREAIAWQQKALAAYPRQPTYRQFLANHYTNLLLAAQGLRDAALTAEARRGLAELAAGDPAGATLDTRLAAVLAGAVPQDNTEQRALAVRAYETQRYAAASGLWAAVLAADPSLAADRQAQHPYNAACAAALAAAGEGTDSPVAEAARARLRAQALAWLRGELEAWKAIVEASTPDQRTAVAAILRHWREDPDLASVRDPEALALLPAEERSAWKALWADVAGLTTRASGAELPRAEPDLPPEVFAR